MPTCKKLLDFSTRGDGRGCSHARNRNRCGGRRHAERFGRARATGTFSEVVTGEGIAGRRSVNGIDAKGYLCSDDTALRTG